MSEVKGFKLVPASMLLDKETIGVINFHCGDGADGQFGEYSDGHLWVGAVTDDDGKEVYGLHLSTAEYPEEGSSTLVEFEAPEDAARVELAALREELQTRTADLLECGTRRKAAEQRLADAERRNAEFIELLNLADHYLQDQFFNSAGEIVEPNSDDREEVRASIRNALTKPTESGAS